MQGPPGDGGQDRLGHLDRGEGGQEHRHHRPPQVRAGEGITASDTGGHFRVVPSVIGAVCLGFSGHDIDGSLNA